MTSITIFHDPTEVNKHVYKEKSTLTGYVQLDSFFIRLLSLARCREIELEVNTCLPEPLPILVEDLVRVLDEMLEALTRMTELASSEDLWARFIIQEQGKSLRMECHTTETIEHNTSFIAKFVGLIHQLGGTANLDGDGELQILWAEFPLLEHTKFPQQHKTLL